METIIIVNGVEMHLVLNKSVEQWDGNDNPDLWSFDFTEVLDGTIEVNPDIWYWYIAGRVYETNYEV